MLIPTTITINEVSEVKDGEVAVECTICKKKFAVPADLIQNVKDNETLVCTVCGQAADTAAVLDSASSMKTNDAADTISKALGK